MLSALSTKTEFSPVASFEELWNECVQAIYGDSRPPAAARQWFLTGAACLFEVLDLMAEKLDVGESEYTTNERINYLRQHLRKACGRTNFQGGSRDWGPH